MAGGISDEDIQRVREATDLVALVGERVPVKPKGRDAWCCCPLHHEKTPSFKIDPGRQTWHCFGCGEGGDAFSFLMKLDGVSFPESVRILADRAHITITEQNGKPSTPREKKSRLKKVCEATADFYHQQLMRLRSPEADDARAYLQKRSLGGVVPKTWCLGFAPGHGSLVTHLGKCGFTPDEMVEANVAVRRDRAGLRDRFFNRIMFPIFDEAGECIAFGGRVIGSGEPKYLNSQETPIFHKSSVLYGLNKAKEAMTASGDAIVVEGYTDVIALHEAGITNVVATLGTALTLRHIRLLSRYASKRIIYLFDGDAAGQRAADRALEFIDYSMTPEAGASRVELYAVTLPNNLDPADYVTSEGAPSLQELVAHAQPLLSYGIERRLEQFDLSTAEGRTRALPTALQVLAPIKDSLLAKDYAIQLASRTRTREEDVLAMLAELKPSGAQVSHREETTEAEVESQAPQKPHSTRTPMPLSAAEKSRRKLERELLCLFAQNPQLALGYAHVLTQTQWHRPSHEKLANELLDLLIEQPDIAPSVLLSTLVTRMPETANALSVTIAETKAQASSMAAYMAEELLLGDLEDQIALLKNQLKTDQTLSAADHDALFQSIVGLQKDLAQRRSAQNLL